MHNFIAAIANCSYMFRLDEVAIKRLYISEVNRGNYVPFVDI